MTIGITRRDFMNGIAIAIAGAAAIDLSASAADALAAAPPPYPPGRDGLRGSHAGSFEAAHRLRDGSTFDLSQAALTEHYDLIVVGAGISGLAAAHFYRQRHAHARVLILDTNDDFGGHAKRNEFEVDGQMLLGYGGTQSIDGPAHKWDGVARGLLKDLGIDVDRFKTAFDQGFYDRWNLGQSVFFKKEVFGMDRLVRRPFGTWAELDEDPHDGAALHAYLDQFPVGPRARSQLFEMMWSDRDVLPGKTAQQRLKVLEHLSYRDFLKQYWDADDEVLKFLQKRTHELWAVGIDAVPASETLTLPGLKAQRKILEQGTEEPYIYHFPDGNASIARMLVRRLIPGIAPGNSMEDIVLARFDYSQVDRPEQAVRIRLNSTAVDVRNVAEGVEVAYVNGGKVARVAARHCVLACYHAMIPYIASETGAEQRKALHENVRAPLVYVNVAVRNWRPWHKLGVAYIDNPGGTFSASLDFPVSLDGYRFTAEPSKPACLHLMSTPAAPNQGLNMREQYRAGRARLYSTSFADFEHEIRDELGRMLAATDFNFDRDVAAITVNRWPHGYAYTPTPLYDDPAAAVATGQRSAPAARPHCHRQLRFRLGRLYPRRHRSGASRRAGTYG